MLVTINTDACFHTRFRFGGYAFWAISDEFKITKSGNFRKKCISSDDAEAKCIINALKVVLLAHNGIHKVIVNTDSLNAIGLLKNDRKHIRKYLRLDSNQIRNLQEAYKKVLNQSKNNVTIEFRHVRAHTSTDDARSYVNDWCDTEAKKQMWAKINNSKTV